MFLKVLASCFWTCLLVPFSNFPLDFGTRNRQHVTSYKSKTISFPKSHLRNKLEQSMVSGCLLPSFWHHFRSISVTDFCDDIFGRLLWTLIQQWSKIVMESPSLFLVFGTIFWPMFYNGVFEGSLARFGFLWGICWVVLNTCLVQFWHRRPSLSAPNL